MSNIFSEWDVSQCSNHLVSLRTNCNGDEFPNDLGQFVDISVMFLVTDGQAYISIQIYQNFSNTMQGPISSFLEIDFIIFVFRSAPVFVCCSYKIKTSSTCIRIHHSAALSQK